MISLAGTVPTKLSLAAIEWVTAALRTTGQLGETSATISTASFVPFTIAYSISLLPKALIAFKSTLYHTSSLAFRSK